MAENGSKQSEQPKKEVINDYPNAFTKWMDFQVSLLEIAENVDLSVMDTIYKKMELYYRIKLLRKTIKEQIEDGKA